MEIKLYDFPTWDYKKVFECLPLSVSSDSASVFLSLCLFLSLPLEFSHQAIRKYQSYICRYFNQNLQLNSSKELSSTAWHVSEKDFEITPALATI